MIWNNPVAPLELFTAQGFQFDSRPTMQSARRTAAGPACPK
jgi:hypothetical protein